MSKYANAINRYIRRQSLQRGSALIIALVFLLALTMIGTTAMQGTSQQEKMASNMRDRNLAFQAAEAALRAAENAVLNNGITAPSDGPPPGPMDDQNWRNNAPRQLGAGAFSVAPNAISLAGISNQPLLFIEDLNTNLLNCCPGGSVAVGCPTCDDYRITTRAEGGTTDAVVVLESIFRRP